MATGRGAPPVVILHGAASLDGKIDHITPDLGLFYELAAGFDTQAHLAGSETILAQAGLTVDAAREAPGPVLPEPDDRRPLLVVPDSRGRIQHWWALRRMPYWRGHVALCARTTPATYRQELAAQGVDCITAGETRVDLRAALSELAARHDVRRVHVDSGGVLSGVLLREGLVREISVLVCPTLVGDARARPLFREPDPERPGPSLPLRLLAAEPVRDGGVWLRYDLEQAPPGDPG
jgi:2,5-diamino-6-(ribosylamino)-4(3H)-pyrimidinone 5'-phosphate reductase